MKTKRTAPAKKVVRKATVKAKATAAAVDPTVKTLRDDAAFFALQGILAFQGPAMGAPNLAMLSYEIADAMLIERVPA